MEHNPQDSFDAAGAGASPTPAPPPVGDLPGAAERVPAREGRMEQRTDTTRDTASQTADQAKQKVNQVADQAKRKASEAAEQAKRRAGQARERADQLKMTLADKLDAGAGKLRQKTASAADELESSAGGDGATTVAQKQKMDKVGNAVASGMEGTAHWLRTADMDSIRGDIEHQVRTNPGRSLLVALGLGYVLARMFRGGSSEG